MPLVPPTFSVLETVDDWICGMEPICGVLLGGLMGELSRIASNKLPPLLVFLLPAVVLFPDASIARAIEIPSMICPIRDYIIEGRKVYS